MVIYYHPRVISHPQETHFKPMNSFSKAWPLVIKSSNFKPSSLEHAVHLKIKTLSKADNIGLSSGEALPNPILSALVKELPFNNLFVRSVRHHQLLFFADMIIFTGGVHHPSSCVHAFHTVLQSWELLARMNEARVHCAVATSRREIFVSGGLSSGNTMCTCEIYSTATSR